MRKGKSIIALFTSPKQGKWESDQTGKKARRGREWGEGGGESEGGKGKGMERERGGREKKKMRERERQEDK